MSLDKHGAQLFRYFSVCPAKVGVLTNGTEYRFFSDTEAENRMDLIPFLTVDLLDLKPGQETQLERFCRENFDLETLMPSIETLAERRRIQEAISNAFEDPPEELIKYFIRQIRDGSVTAKAMERYGPMIREGIRSYLNDRVNSRLQSAISEPSEPAPEPPSDGIVTTEDELEGFRIVKAIASEVVDPDRIVYRDNRSYFNILLDDTNRQQVCRLYLNSSKWYIGTYEEKVENKQPIDKVADIYGHRGQILGAIRRYIGDE